MPAARVREEPSPHAAAGKGVDFGDSMVEELKEQGLDEVSVLAPGRPLSLCPGLARVEIGAARRDLESAAPPNVRFQRSGMGLPRPTPAKTRRCSAEPLAQPPRTPDREACQG